jgi:transposase-like protein
VPTRVPSRSLQPNARHTRGAHRVACTAGSQGRFRTEVFERYQRSEKALVAAMLEMYVQGVSTRKVKTITEARVQFINDQPDRAEAG